MDNLLKDPDRKCMYCGGPPRTWVQHVACGHWVAKCVPCVMRECTRCAEVDDLGVDVVIEPQVPALIEAASAIGTLPAFAKASRG